MSHPVPTMWWKGSFLGPSFFLNKYGIFLKGSLKTYRNLVIIPVFSPYFLLGVGDYQKMSIKQTIAPGEGI